MESEAGRVPILHCDVNEAADQEGVLSTINYLFDPLW